MGSCCINRLFSLINISYLYFIYSFPISCLVLQSYIQAHSAKSRSRHTEALETLREWEYNLETLALCKSM
ncbi:hypothetical protein AAS21_gp181 [Pantoea phage vB_PagS_AAS21]|uniref:Uncharacterized protein n=1 Tax=Pantoea phage vB_PagS_AAS21 TaxID=2575261 RepID=A0A4Y5P1T9_9CAUD|nr:hypothetical protein AAS21_gp181 [Pantoea phage vB_PagS_AAS21]